MTARRPVARQRQYGVAVVTALLVVALATLAITGVMWRQQVQLRAVENQIALAQSRWLARAAVDWARLLLQFDMAGGQGSIPNVDHNSEPWALPLAETRIADAEGTDNREAFLSGRVVDEQSRINLFDLLQPNGATNIVTLSRLTRLLSALNLDPGLADKITAGLLDTQTTQAPRTEANPNGQQRIASRLPWLTVEDLIRVSGVNADVVEALRPHVTFLPRVDGQPVPVNLNTASPEVLYATIPELTSLQMATDLAKSRDKIPLKDVADVGTRIPGGKLSVTTSAISVNSKYFHAQGRIRYERALMTIDTLIYRDVNGTRVFWQRES